MSDERRDDWKSGVDDRLMSLTSSQRTTDDQLDDLELKYEALDRVMRGDPEKETDGFIARLHAVETWIQEEKIERVRRGVTEDKNLGIKWQFWGAIIVAIIGLLGGILPNLALIRTAFQGKEVHYRPDAKLKKEIQKDKDRQKRKKAHSANGPSLAPLPEATTNQK